MRILQFRAALGFLTRLPGGAAGPPGPAAWSFPLVGLIVGGVQALAGQLAIWAGLPAAVAALLALTAGVLVTGGLHEDGLADTADGFWGGHSTARRLEIMRDSQIGSYGVLALILAFGLQAAALSALAAGGALWAALLTAGAVSRAAFLPLMAYMLYARRDGVGRGAGRPTPQAMLCALGIGAGVALVLTGWAAFMVALVVTILSGLMARAAHRLIGGVTGDVLGATQMVAQVAVLVCLSA